MLVAQEELEIGGLIESVFKYRGWKTFSKGPNSK